MGKKKTYQRITVQDLDNMVAQKHPGKICPSCGKPELFAGGIQTKYDDYDEEEIVMSFTVFCHGCGDVFDRWDQTGRNYYL